MFSKLGYAAKTPGCSFIGRSHDYPKYNLCHFYLEFGQGLRLLRLSLGMVYRKFSDPKRNF